MKSFGLWYRSLLGNTSGLSSLPLIISSAFVGAALDLCNCLQTLFTACLRSSRTFQSPLSPIPEHLRPRRQRHACLRSIPVFSFWAVVSDLNSALSGFSTKTYPTQYYCTIYSIISVLGTIPRADLGALASRLLRLGASPALDAA